MRQEGDGEQDELFPGVAMPQKGAAEAAGGGTERWAFGLLKIVDAEVGKVFGGFPVGVAVCEILGDDF